MADKQSSGKGVGNKLNGRKKDNKKRIERGCKTGDSSTRVNGGKVMETGR